ncbi:GlsB/YeaQ/YmgE family stress response membrane protein [Sedimenticola sp.]|uniref:GlsB/YeaQ/YmgE family stress response membrane protein n=1 Tax=Sedimenticola sp. TaxID=1940285 RepID=UPI003D153470
MEVGILAWIVLGLIAGALAKWIMPGPDRGGLIATILLGIAGAFLGGWIGSLLGFNTIGGFKPGGLVSATLGALLLLYLFRTFKR